ncbi:hypothetical protein RND81_11G029600 [Saponaria officinalis]|uniref:Uncharacterized protein n=1 Tax=Saponaria officinalis TaxID=3572 RepID=A0AAW1HGD3_SAPOF
MSSQAKQAKSLEKTMEVQCETLCDWQQKYWQMHLQNWFDAAAERAMLPSFAQCVGLIELPGVSVSVTIYLNDCRRTASNEGIGLDTQEFYILVSLYL